LIWKRLCAVRVNLRREKKMRGRDQRKREWDLKYIVLKSYGMGLAPVSEKTT